MISTMFPSKAIHKATRALSDRTISNQFHHVLVSKQSRKSMKDSEVCRSAEIGKRLGVEWTHLSWRKAFKLKTFKVTLRIGRWQDILGDDDPAEVEEDEEVQRGFKCWRKRKKRRPKQFSLDLERRRTSCTQRTANSLVTPYIKREVVNRNILITCLGRVIRQPRKGYVREGREVKRISKADKDYRQYLKYHRDGCKKLAREHTLCAL